MLEQEVLAMDGGRRQIIIAKVIFGGQNPNRAAAKRTPEY